ncbi:MAG: hypothetical protein EBV32_03715 [Proteobacteria bacterium]|uniref:Uncharacterized protein n=1 Tax=Candidatus Fonsibacter lacus TaxID=2576439 RepID=A0A964V566_9PROT|nr:hypothetical protein [Candidatus Fonsibacter lacus]
MAEYVSTFRMPSEYERAAMEARRRQRMAEMLAQQAYNPMEFQGAPIPKAAPFVQGLQAFLTARQLRKAEEAEKEAKATESDYAKRLAGRMGGVSELPDYGTPEQQAARIDAEEAAQRASGQLQEVTPTAQYRFNPQEALEMASTEVGTAALKNRPFMASRLAEMLKKPEEKKPAKFGTTPQFDAQGNAYIINEAGEMKYLTGVKKPAEVRAPKDERLVSIIGPDGNPVLVRESQAVGKTPYTPRTLAQETAEAAKVQANAQREIDTQSALDNIGELIAHPGRKLATGASSFASKVPGTDAYDFAAKLDTFKAQTFVPMVSALKGMGALSDAEGKKLQAAVGALDPSMSEEAFVNELNKVATTLVAKAKAAGLNVTLPINMEQVIDLPPRGR